jgi:hypothetical protein
MVAFRPTRLDTLSHVPALAVSLSEVLSLAPAKAL